MTEERRPAIPDAGSEPEAVPDAEAEAEAVTESEAVPEAQASPGAEAEAARRRRRAAVFGDVLPDSTRDDRDPGGPDRPDAADEWLRSNVPPHHG